MKKTPTKKARSASKSPARKTPTKAASAKKTPAKKTPVKKTPAKKAAVATTAPNASKDVAYLDAVTIPLFLLLAVVVFFLPNDFDEQLIAFLQKTFSSV